MHGEKKVLIICLKDGYRVLKKVLKSELQRPLFALQLGTLPEINYLC
jgi:hypothetical protein